MKETTLQEIEARCNYVCAEKIRDELFDSYTATTVRRWAQHRKIPSYKIGHNVFFIIEEIRAIMDRIRPGQGRGQDHHGWRGDSVTYKQMHKRVEQAFGKPMKCAVCGTTEAKRYDWANLTGRYIDITDYKRMCRSCHRRYDFKRNPPPPPRRDKCTVGGCQNLGRRQGKRDFGQDYYYGELCGPHYRQELMQRKLLPGEAK